MIHNGGLVMGMLAFFALFAFIAFLPEETDHSEIVDWDKEGWL